METDLIPLHVGARCLAAILAQNAANLLGKGPGVKRSPSYEKKKQAAGLQIDAEELYKFSRSQQAQTGLISPATLGYLVTFCYGHLQLKADLAQHLSGIADELLSKYPPTLGIPDPAITKATTLRKIAEEIATSREVLKNRTQILFKIIRAI